ncbi:hypothetical protein STEG23_030136, partial [Scotinomys teguina]
RRSSQSPSEEEPQSLPRTQEQPVTLGRRGPKSNHSPLEEEDPRSSQSPSEDKHQPLPETQEQPVTLRIRGPRSSQSSSEEEDQRTASHPQRKRTQEHPDTIVTRDLPCSPSKAEMGRCQCKSTYKNIKKKTSPESSPPPAPRPKHCNVNKAEENDF